jgi:hypothetical protein
MKTVIIEYLEAEGKHTCVCQWKYIKKKRRDIFNKVIQRAGGECKLFYRKIEREPGYLNQSYPMSGTEYFKVLEEKELTLQEVEELLK